MRAQRRQRERAIVAGLLLGLSACATPEIARQEGSGPASAASARPQQPDDAALNAALQALKASAAAGRTGTVKGFGFLTASPAPPVVFAKGALSLIPSTPALETALRNIARKWRQGLRRPLSESEAQAAFALLNRHVGAVRALGGGHFILAAESDDQGRFAFEAVPAGRWLLVTDMESPVSAILWAIPTEAEAGETIQVIVTDGDILLEGHKPAGKRATTPP